MNTTQVNKLETKFKNLKMGDFHNIDEYIARLENLKANITTYGSKAKTESKYVSM
jgi:hypothetical protein